LIATYTLEYSIKIKSITKNNNISSNYAFKSLQGWNSKSGSIFINLICQRERASSIMEIIRKKPKSLIRSFNKTLIPNSCTQLTSCELNLAAKRCNLDIRKNFLSQRVISNWNALPEEIKRARTLKTFTFLYDEHIKNHYGQQR